MYNGIIELLSINTSLTQEESKEFLDILGNVKDTTNMMEDDIITEYFDNWSSYSNYDEAWEEEQTFDDAQTEEEFKQHSYVLSSGRCLIRDYK